MSLSGEDGLDAMMRRNAMQREAMLPARRRVQPNYVRALTGAHWFTGGKKEPSLPFSLDAEGSTGAEVGGNKLIWS